MAAPTSTDRMHHYHPLYCIWSHSYKLGFKKLPENNDFSALKILTRNRYTLLALKVIFVKKRGFLLSPNEQKKLRIQNCVLTKLSRNIFKNTFAAELTLNAKVV